MHTSQYTTKAYSLHIKRIRTMTQNSANATDLSSLLFPKPLWFYIIRYFSTSNNPQQEAAFNAAWQYPQFRAYIRNVTILWGIVYVVEFLIRIVMVYTMPISQFLIISPIIFYGITILVIWITIRSGARLRKRAPTLRRRNRAGCSGPRPATSAYRARPPSSVQASCYRPCRCRHSPGP